MAHHHPHTPPRHQHQHQHQHQHVISQPTDPILNPQQTTLLHQTSSTSFFTVNCSGVTFYLSIDMLSRDAPNIFSTAFNDNNQFHMDLDLDPDLFALIIAHLRGHMILPLKPEAIPTHLTPETARLQLIDDASRLGLRKLITRLSAIVGNPNDPRPFKLNNIIYSLNENTLIGRIRLSDLAANGALFKVHPSLGLMYKNIPSQVKDHFGHSEAVAEIHTNSATVHLFPISPTQKKRRRDERIPPLDPALSIRFQNQYEEKVVVQAAGLVDTIAGVPIWPIPHQVLGLITPDGTRREYEGEISITGVVDTTDEKSTRYTTGGMSGMPESRRNTTSTTINKGIGGWTSSTAAWDFEMEIDGRTYSLREILVFAQCWETVSLAVDKAIWNDESLLIKDTITGTGINTNVGTGTGTCSGGTRKYRPSSLHGAAAIAAAGISGASQSQSQNPNNDNDHRGDTPRSVSAFSSPPAPGSRKPFFSKSFFSGNNSSNSSPIISDKESTQPSRGSTAPTTIPSHPSLGIDKSYDHSNQYFNEYDQDEDMNMVKIAKNVIHPAISTAISTGLALGMNYREALRMSEIIDADIECSELQFRIVPIPGDILHRRTLRLVKLKGTTRRGELYRVQCLV